MNFQVSRFLTKKLYLFYSSLRFFSSHEIHFQILSNGSLNSSKSLLISASGNRYLINCGEGTQKIFAESKRLSSLNNVFITRNSQHNLCGIIGLVKGIECRDGIDLCLHGTKYAVDLIRASRAFNDVGSIKINHNDSFIFEDSALFVSSFKYTSANSCHGDQCVGYLFASKDVKPRMNRTKCQTLGVQRTDVRQSKINDICTKSHVTLDDGKIIESNKGLCDPLPQKKCLVIECPTVDHVTNMVEAIPFDQFNDGRSCLSLVFHLTDRSIYNHESYQHFIQRINSTTANSPTPNHVLIDSEVIFPLSYSSYYLQTCLNHFFDEQMFPKLKLYEDYIATKSDSVTEDNECNSTILAEPFMEFTSNGVLKTDNVRDHMWRHLKYLNEEEVINEVLNNNQHCPSEFMLAKMEQLKRELAMRKAPVQDNNSLQYPNLTFIGTSSSTPSKYRNVTSILIESSAEVFELLDCGEGTVDRILLLHGLARGQHIIRNIRMIFVSHHHLDHHLGLYTLLRYRELIGDCKPCLILSGSNVRRFVEDVDEIFATAHRLYNCHWCLLNLLPMANNRSGSEKFSTNLHSYEKELGLQIKPVRVFHTDTSYGLVLSGLKPNSSELWKISYSGDCYPKFDGLIKEGIDSDILIHEATFDDGLEVMASQKRHSTVSQAIGEGIKMRAKFTMLTHFSSRYCLVSPIEERYQTVANAFDFMKVDLRSCHNLKILNSYLEYLFPRHWNDLAKTRQRLLRKNSN